MKDKLLLGLGRSMLPLPRLLWRSLLKAKSKKVGAGLGFMTEHHHRVRDHVVTELPRAGVPLPPDSIAEKLRLPVSRAQEILRELERNLKFLYRDERGRVAWAYPATVEETPHRVRFSTGERGYAA